MKPNLLLVTEHYPCGTQESFLENEIQYLNELFRVHVISTDTDRLMTRALPKGVVFSRPAETVSGFKRLFTLVRCLFSRGYLEECRAAKSKGKLTAEFRQKTLKTLVKSRLLYDYIRNLEFFQREEPLLIYSANLNDYLYGLCCLKDYSDDIRVVARCHNANMFDPRTGSRRDTLNGVINRTIDAIYFTSEHSRQLYADHFADGSVDQEKLRVARLGVPGQEREELEPLPDFYLRIVTCCPMEQDKRLPLIIDALSGIQTGCVEWVHIGTGSQRQKILDYAEKKLGGKTGVRYKFFGKMSHEEIYRYYRENYVDLFLSVSEAESVPTAMMEAMANRIFVAATNVDGVSDVVDNESGMLLPGNPEAEQLSRAIESLCRISKEHIAQKGLRAYQCWKEKFDAEKNCVQFAETLARVSGQSGEEVKAHREEARKQQGKGDRPRSVFDPLQTPAARADIHEMPVSFIQSLQEDGILQAEKDVPLESADLEPSGSELPLRETPEPEPDEMQPEAAMQEEMISAEEKSGETLEK